MKKITALLLSCMMIGCTFTACGKDNDDDDSSAKSTSSSESTEDSTEKTSSEKNTTEDKKTTEASTEDKKTTEASTEASAEASSENKITTEAKTEVPTQNQGGSNDGNLEKNIIGKWEASKMIAQGTEMTEFMGVPMHALMHIEIQPNGKCVLTSPMDEAEAQNGTWKVSGKDKVVIDFPDEDGESDSEEFQYKNGTLVASETEDGETVEIHLKKVDKFSEFDFEKWQQEMQNSLGGMTQAGTPAN